MLLLVLILATKLPSFYAFDARYLHAYVYFSQCPSLRVLLAEHPAQLNSSRSGSRSGSSSGAEAAAVHGDMVVDSVRNTVEDNLEVDHSLRNAFTTDTGIFYSSESERTGADASNNTSTSTDTGNDTSTGTSTGTGRLTLFPLSLILTYTLSLNDTLSPTL